MSMVWRFVGFFAVLFVVTAALDVWTTELGRQRPNTVELNPSGFRPLKQSILGEIPLLLVGTGLVATGTWFRRATLAQATNLNFRAFLGAFWFKGSYFAALLLFAPIAIAALRFTAISNNAMHLTLGWSVWDRWLLDPIQAWTHLSQIKAYQVMLFIISILGWVPVTWLIYRVATAGRDASG